MTNEFSRKPFQNARRDLRDLITVPVQAWMMIPPARRNVRAYRTLTDIPLDLAAAGFNVTVVQDDRGWTVAIKKDLMEMATLHLTGGARSYAAALFQLADQAALAIADLEAAARATWESEASELGDVA
jgi:hypothetical protein